MEKIAILAVGNCLSVPGRHYDFNAVNFADKASIIVAKSPISTGLCHDVSKIALQLPFS